MKVTRTDKSPTQTHLVINADASDLEPIKRHVLAHFRHSVKIPGFRAGTAPMALIEKHIDQKALLDEFLEHALNQLYSKAVQQENLRSVGQPKVQMKKFVPYSELELDVETEIIGKVALPDYKKIRLSRTLVSITAKDVNDVIKSLQERSADRKETNRPAKLGDEVTIDFSGKDNEGKAVAGTDAKDYPLVLGSGNFIPGFEDNLIGLKTGEEKEFDVKFPADYGVAALQNKAVTFTAKLDKVSELEIPKADDNFAAKAGPFKTLADMKADIKKQLKLERDQQAERDYANRLVGEIIEQSNIDLPDAMVDEQISRMEDEEKKNLTYQGKTWQEHLSEEGVSEQQHRDRQRPQAEQQIKGGIVLGEVADKEGITVTPSELDERIKLLKGQYQDTATQAELEKPDGRRDVEGRMLTEKTINKLVEFSQRTK